MNLEYRDLFLALVWFNYVSFSMTQDRRNDKPWNLIVFIVNENLVLTWLPPNVPDKNVVRYQINDTSVLDETFETNQTYLVFQNIVPERQFVIRAMFDNGTVSPDSKITYHPENEASNTVYATAGQNATFKWNIPAAIMRSNLRVKKHQSDETLFQINMTDDSICDVSMLYQGRIHAAKSDVGNLSFVLSDIRSWDSGYYMTSEENDVISGQLLVVLEKPSKPSISANTTATFGSPLKLTCTSISQSKPEYHGLSMHCDWKFNGDNIQPGNDYVIGDDVIIIRSIDSSNYTCRCFEENGPLSEESDRFMYNFDSDSTSHHQSPTSGGAAVAIVVTVIFSLITALVLGYTYKVKRIGRLNVNKNPIEYSQGIELQATDEPVIEGKAAVILGQRDIPQKSERRKSGKIVIMNEDEVAYTVVEAQNRE